jgi:hypothetical protein
VSNGTESDLGQREMWLSMDKLLRRVDEEEAAEAHRLGRLDQLMRSVRTGDFQSEEERRYWDCFYRPKRITASRYSFSSSAAEQKRRQGSH